MYKKVDSTTTKNKLPKTNYPENQIVFEMDKQNYWYKSVTQNYTMQNKNKKQKTKNKKQKTKNKKQKQKQKSPATRR